MGGEFMILISGGAGFIGSHLVERLWADGKQVNIRDNFSSAVWSKREVDDLVSIHPGSNWSEGSIQRMAYHGNPDAIYHLASPVGPAGILPYAGRIVDEIVSGTYKAIEIALESRCRLVYVSTSEIYGGGVNGLCREDTPCIVPIVNPTARLEYAIGKLAGEIAVLNTPGLDAVIIRPFNVAGPRQSDKGGFVLPRLVKQHLHDERMTLFGDGTQIRAFTHVSDIVDGLILAMQRGKSGQAYNLGNPTNKVTINELAGVILQVYELMDGRYTRQNAPFINYVKYMDGREVYGPAYAEANDKYPDASKAMGELGWNPKYNIWSIVKDVIEYERVRA